MPDYLHLWGILLDMGSLVKMGRDLPPEKIHHTYVSELKVDRKRSCSRICIDGEKVSTRSGGARSFLQLGLTCSFFSEYLGLIRSSWGTNEEEGKVADSCPLS